MRLIDADALLQRAIPHGWSTPKWVSDIAIDDAPTIDAVPVKHGKWIKMSDADGVYWACSECGEDIPRIAHYDPQFDLFPRLESIDRTNYCPHCGAKMES